jgi:hypothetical protein
MDEGAERVVERGAAPRGVLDRLHGVEIGAPNTLRDLHRGSIS